MGDNYDRLWTINYGETPTGENSWAWTVAIKDLSAKQITNGIRRVIEQCLKYPPKPIQFRGLCLNDNPEEVEDLFQEVVSWGQLSQEQKSRKGLFIIRKLDHANFKRANEQRAREMFSIAYSKLLKHVADGKELPEFLVEIEHVEQPPMPMEKRSSFFADLMKAVDNPQGA